MRKMKRIRSIVRSSLLDKSGYLTLRMPEHPIIDDDGNVCDEEGHILYNLNEDSINRPNIEENLPLIRENIIDDDTEELPY